MTPAEAFRWLELRALLNAAKEPIPPEPIPPEPIPPVPIQPPEPIQPEPVQPEPIPPEPPPEEATAPPDLLRMFEMGARSEGEDDVDGLFGDEAEEPEVMASQEAEAVEAEPEELMLELTSGRRISGRGIFPGPRDRDIVISSGQGRIKVDLDRCGAVYALKSLEAPALAPGEGDIKVRAQLSNGQSLSGFVSPSLGEGTGFVLIPSAAQSNVKKAFVIRKAVHKVSRVK